MLSERLLFAFIECYIKLLIFQVEKCPLPRNISIVIEIQRNEINFYLKLLSRGDHMPKNSKKLMENTKKLMEISAGIRVNAMYKFERFFIFTNINGFVEVIYF